eukprot:1901105-Prymnesium_polylepis.1
MVEFTYVNGVLANASLASHALFCSSTHKTRHFYDIHAENQHTSRARDKTREAEGRSATAMATH